jgi:hypothetical protein
MTAFHNVLPLRYSKNLFVDDYAWEWPTVTFSTNCDGTIAAFQNWQRTNKPPNLYVNAAFKEDLLMKWQNCSSLDNPIFAYKEDSAGNDIIELEVPGNYRTHLSLSVDPSPLTQNEEVICVGYPGPVDDSRDAILYKNTTNHRRPKYVPEFKTVSYGVLLETFDDICSHGCSTSQQNSGSPMLALRNGIGNGRAEVIAMHTSTPDDAGGFSNNFNVGMSKFGWINKL